jgi:hypothetical protein
MLLLQARPLGSRRSIVFFGWFVRRMRGLQVTPQAHVQGDRYTHHDQRADTQDQEPPDHPHSRLG